MSDMGGERRGCLLVIVFFQHIEDILPGISLVDVLLHGGDVICRDQLAQQSLPVDDLEHSGRQGGGGSKIEGPFDLFHTIFFKNIKHWMEQSKRQSTPLLLPYSLLEGLTHLVFKLPNVAVA